MKRILTFALLFAGAFSAGFLGLRSLNRGAGPSLTMQNTPLIDTISASAPGVEVSELMIVYLGSTRCQWCNKQELPPAVRTIIDSIRHRASSTSASYATTVGVDLHPPADDGLKHLAHVAQFDEMALGGGILNAWAIELTWGELAGPAGAPTPQVLVLRRRVTKTNRRGDPLTLTVERPEVLVRKVGLKEILAWVESGVAMQPLVAGQ